MHHHHLISNHQRASIEQIEISSVTSSTKSTESPLEKPEKSKQNRHRNERTARRGKGAGEKDAKGATFFRKQSRQNLLKEQRLPRGKNPKKRNQRTNRVPEKASSHLMEEREKSRSPLTETIETSILC
ncbi:hypothetical protein Bca52824_093034 [Brassica carinata]|uniref:Uncharacterized protein n=1 Tax=Brassica carinata TaxID=52824 RepID=A0A8X7P6I4_BRACI|nr:hypothetical protein Bca52824_093034 [Brassica carinata]